MAIKDLELPESVISYLRGASKQLDCAHMVAGEKENINDCINPNNLRTNLVGNIRDIIFGLNTAISELAQLIEDELNGN